MPLNGSASPRKEFSPRSSAFLTRACGRALLAALIILLLTSLVSAQTLTGTVKNSTTNKPAAGDEVVLLKLSQGMEEAGRTKTDAQGHFSFKLDDAQSPHLVRVIHEDVTYHRMAPPGTTSVELEVYDVGKKIDGVQVIADVMRIQAEQGQLEIQRAFAVQNNSKPPRTQMNEHNLEFYIPDGAQIIDSSAETAGGQPIKSAPVPEGQKNRYSFIFPLRPGVTQFEVAYQLPYSGSANLDPKSVYPLEHFVAILPKAMQFAAAGTSAGFKPMDDPSQPDSTCKWRPTQHLAKISPSRFRARERLTRDRQAMVNKARAQSHSLQAPRPGHRPPRRRARPTHRRSRPAAEIPLADPRKHRGSVDRRRNLCSRTPTIRSPRSGPPNAWFFSARFFRVGSHAGRRLRSC